MPCALSQSIRRFTSAITSGPMPSPGRSSSLWVVTMAYCFVRHCLPAIHPFARRVLKRALRDWQDKALRACGKPMCNTGRARGLPHYAPLPEIIPCTVPASLSPDRASRAADPDAVADADVIGLGIGRFAYALVLPDMRDALGWSYSAAGFMNTINAAGYLGGALLAAGLDQAFWAAGALRWGTLACVLVAGAVRAVGQFRRAEFCAAADRWALAPRSDSSPAARWRRQIAQSQAGAGKFPA